MAGFRQNVARLGKISLKLLRQPLDMHQEQVIFVDVRSSPNMLEEMIVGRNTIQMGCKRAEQVGQRGYEYDFFACHRHLLLYVVNRQCSDGEAANEHPPTWLQMIAD